MIMRRFAEISAPILSEHRSEKPEDVTLRHLTSYANGTLTSKASSPIYVLAVMISLLMLTVTSCTCGTLLMLSMNDMPRLFRGTLVA